MSNEVGLGTCKMKFSSNEKAKKLKKVRPNSQCFNCGGMNVLSLMANQEE